MPIWEEFRSLCRQNEEKWTDLRSIVANQHSFGTNNNHQSCYCCSSSLSLFCFIKPIFFNWHGRSSGSFPHHHFPCIVYKLMMVLSENIYLCKKISLRKQFPRGAHVTCLRCAEMGKTAKCVATWKCFRLWYCRYEFLPGEFCWSGCRLRREMLAVAERSEKKAKRQER